MVIGMTPDQKNAVEQTSFDLISVDRTAFDQVPLPCTLPMAEQSTRLAEFDGLFTVVRSVERSSPHRLRLTLADAPGRRAVVEQLVAREAECCSFFTFVVTDDDALVLDVAVPSAHVGVLDGIAERATRMSREAP